jgi:hypothetical protein
MDFSSFEAFVDSALILLDTYGFILVILFAIMHPIFEGPLARFNLSLGIVLMGITGAYITIFVFNMIGCVILYILVKKVDFFSNYYLHRKKVSNEILVWLKEAPKWKHIFVLGVPIIPTYPVKIGYYLGEPSFKDIMKTMLGAYVFLFIGNTLIYFGFMNFLESGTSRTIAIILLLILVVFVYFGNSIFSKITSFKKES